MSLEELYCFVDDFCQLFLPEWEKHLLSSGQRMRRRACQLSLSEMLTIYLLFQTSGYRDQGLQLITGIRKSMKNKLMPLIDKLLLRKRSLIESVNNQLKHVFHLEHHRHRSAFNGFANILAALIAYVFHPNKPALKCKQKNLLCSIP